jgi:hypothetical protein
MKALKYLFTSGLALLAFIIAFGICAGYASHFGLRIDRDLWINGAMLPIALFASYFTAVMSHGASEGRKLAEVFDNDGFLVTGTVLAIIIIVAAAVYYAMAGSTHWTNVILIFMALAILSQKR